MDINKHAREEKEHAFAHAKRLAGWFGLGRYEGGGPVPGQYGADPDGPWHTGAWRR